LKLPQSWNGKDVQLDVNRIRDYDLTYVKRKLIGSQQNAEPKKIYNSHNVLHAGKNVIAVQIINYFDKGGIAGYKDTSRHISVYPVGDELQKFH